MKNNLRVAKAPERQSKAASVLHFAVFAFAILSLVAIALPESYAAPKFNNTGIYDDSTSTKLASKDSIVVCRSTGVVDDIIYRFSCDQLCSYTDTDCGDNINTAIASCPVTGCRVSIRGGGSYPISTTIHPINNLELVGVGKPVLQRTAAINIVNNSNSSPMENITIKGIVFNGNKSITDVKGIRFNFLNTTNLKILENEFYDFNDSFAVSVGSQANNQWANDFTFAYNKLDRVEFGVGLEANISKISFNTFRDNYFNTSSTSEYGEAIECNYGEKSVIMGNVIDGFGEEGIDDNCHRSEIIGNTITMSCDRANSTGIATGRNTGTSIIGNSVQNICSDGKGILAGGSTQAENGLVITGNHLRAASSGIGTGVFVESEYTLVDANTFRDLLLGINATSPNPTTVRIGDNNIFRSVTTPIFANSTEVVVNYVNSSGSTMTGRLEITNTSTGVAQYIRLRNQATATNSGSKLTFTNSGTDTDHASITALRTNSPAQQATALIFSTTKNSSALDTEHMRLDPYGYLWIKGVDNNSILLHHLLSNTGDTVALNFKVSADTTSTDSIKAAIIFERTGTGGIGKLHLATTSNTGSTSVTKTDAAITIQNNKTTTFLNLTGSGNDYACLDANGNLYRSDLACA